MNLLEKISFQKPFGIFAAVTVISALLAVAFQTPLLMGVPVVLLLVFVAITDYKSLFFLLLTCIPISVEYQFPNGLGTDLPTEPLIVVLMFIYLLTLFQGSKSAKDKTSLSFQTFQRRNTFFRHPISLLLIVGLAWATVATLSAVDTVIATKYMLAKIWYIVTFYYLGSAILQTEHDFKRFFWSIFIPLSIAVIITTIRHAALDFSFSEVNYVMQPFFRNHVNYACIVAIFLPFIGLALTWTRRGTARQRLLIGGILLFLFAIQLSFTRAAYGAVIGAVGYYFIIRWRLTKCVVAASIIGIIGFVAYITSENKYLDYAPRFERTITHQNFDNLLEATTKGEDISTMERVYRWVAGFMMVGERPLTGFGPNNFYDNYKIFTVTKFQTYVSDNPDHSTVHCYYLLMAIEHGIIGALLFFALVFYVLVRGEQIYHNAVITWRKHTIMASMLSMVTILILIVINDLIETDKIGSFFYLNLAILTSMDVEQVLSPQSPQRGNRDKQ
ncbi:MAG: O-antigen ligase family protein [Saprospiraceae bacterium]|nr:O-antigen ligase family protein [Saprospiraceae bacterium]